MRSEDNRRKAERVDAGFVIQIKCDTFDQFLQEHAVNISQGGYFYTDEPTLHCRDTAPFFSLRRLIRGS